MGQKQKKHIRWNRVVLAVLLFLTVTAAICTALYLAIEQAAQDAVLTQQTASEAVPPEQPAEPEATAGPETEPEPEPEPEPTRLRFSAVGDNLIHGSIYLQGQRRAVESDKDYDFTYLYADCADFLKCFDVNFINQETLVTDELVPDTYPTFATPGEIGREIYRLGWRVFGTSNNHIYDKGAVGISSTLRFWEQMPEDVVTVGLYKDAADYDNIRLQEINGITIAYVAYTQYTNGIPTPSDAEAHIIYTSQLDIIQQQLEKAAGIADVVIASVHWGIEDSHTVTDEQRELAAQMGNWGANVIIGTHPHVVQTMELLTNDDGSETLCAYSLGNFVSAQSRPDELIGCSLTFDLVKPSDGEVSLENIHAYPFVTHYGGGYSNIRVLPLSSYTEEEALQHGVRTEYPYFNTEYIRQVLQENIPEEWLCWDAPAA